MQKFRLPFKNMSQVDTEFEFIFIKSPKGVEGLAFDPQTIFEHMQFFCQPSVLQLPGAPKDGGAAQAAMLNVQIKVDTEWFKNEVPEDKVYTMPKLLIARVKGTSLLQSFFVTVCLVNGSSE